MTTIKVWTIQGNHTEYTDSIMCVYNFTVNEGHLTIKRQVPKQPLQIVRILAPGKWIEVTVDYDEI